MLMQGILKDGCKVVLFGGIFEEGESRDKVVIKLFYNGVRRANRHAKIGYVNPIHLERPISVASVHAGAVVYL